MVSDYPDWTDLIHLVGTDIMLAIDVQGAYIMMPVDIQAQYLTLDINIKAQDVVINIDIEAQSVGIYLKADWEVLQGNEKIMVLYTTNVPWANSDYVEYVVPEGKTFFVTYFTGLARAYAAADADKAQHFQAKLRIWGTDYVWVGGDGGFAVTLPTPLAVDGEDKIYGYIENRANHAMTMAVTVGGYQI